MGLERDGVVASQEGFPEQVGLEMVVRGGQEGVMVG